MNRITVAVVTARAAAIRATLAARQSYSPSSFLFATVIAMNIVLALSAFVLIQYYGKDVLSSLTFFPADGTWLVGTDINCVPGVEGLGVHCFGDYTLTTRFTERANPWEQFIVFHFNYTPAGMLVHWILGGLSTIAGVPRLGLFIYLALLVVALAIPAVWASMGKPMATRLLTLGAFGLLAIPALMSIDRGNSIALAVPVLLFFLLGLRRENLTMVAVSIVLAAMVKPQFALLVVALFVIRKWKVGLVTLGGIVVTNLLAFLAWPRDFPSTIPQAISNTLSYGGGIPLSDDFPTNVSFARAAYLLQKLGAYLLGVSPSGGLTNLMQQYLGLAVVGVLVVALLMLGRRVPPHLTGILLLAGAAMYAGTSWSYYLVFALPVAAIILRDPLGPTEQTRWRGVFDWQEAQRPSRLKQVTIAVLVLATASSVSRLVLPVVATDPTGQHTNLVTTSAVLAPLLWMTAGVLALIAWWRRESVPGPDPIS